MEKGAVITIAITVLLPLASYLITYCCVNEAFEAQKSERATLLLGQVERRAH